jgi:hypothetical protein
MKKALLAAILVSMLLAWASASSAQVPEPLAFYPLKVGQKWTYQVTDLKAPQQAPDAKRNVVIEVEREEPYVRPKMTTKDGKELEEKKFTGYILKSTSGGKVTRDHVVAMEDGIYRVHAAETQISPPLPFIKWPNIFQAKAWEANATSGNTTIKATFTPKLEDVKLNTGEATKLLTVSYRDHQPGGDRVEIDYYFLPGIGMYQQRVKTKNHEIMLKLVANQK